jgi:formyltetrahydrofolate deformylase
VSATATLVVSCPDRKGLVAALASLLHDHGANILEAQQHLDPVERIFSQRIHFDLADLDLPRAQLEDLLRIECGRYQMRWHIAFGDRPKRVAIFVSRFEHCLYDLLIRHRLGELRCEIPLVVSNHPDLHPIATQFGVDYQVFPIDKQTKSAQEARELALLESERIDLVVLARYMQVLSDAVCTSLAGRAINIHHSFLPGFKGAKPYHQAHDRGVKLIGATAHYVTTDLDEGPIIEQEVARVDHSIDVDELIAVGRDLECQALSRAVRWYAERRILLNGSRTIVFR